MVDPGRVGISRDGQPRRTLTRLCKFWCLRETEHLQESRENIGISGSGYNVQSPINPRISMLAQHQHAQARDAQVTARGNRHRVSGSQVAHELVVDLAAARRSCSAYDRISCWDNHGPWHWTGNWCLVSGGLVACARTVMHRAPADYHRRVDGEAFPASPARTRRIGCEQHDRTKGRFARLSKFMEPRRGGARPWAVSGPVCCAIDSKVQRHTTREHPIYVQPADSRRPSHRPQPGDRSRHQSAHRRRPHRRLRRGRGASPTPKSTPRARSSRPG